MAEETLPLAEILAKAGDDDFFVWRRGERTADADGSGCGGRDRRQAFLQPDRAAASQTLRHVADQLRGQWPKLGDFIDDSEVDVLTFLDFPAQHRTRIHSTNSLERLNKEVKRRADVVGIFPNERAIIRLIGAVLLDANDEWQIRNRYMQTEPMAELLAPIIDAETTRISTATA